MKLNPDQISRAKHANGSRKRITHALMCGPYGQMFGTEKQCLKYFTLWDPAYRIEVAPGKFKSMFSGLFAKAVRTDKYTRLLQKWRSRSRVRQSCKEPTGVNCSVAEPHRW